MNPDGAGSEAMRRWVSRILETHLSLALLHKGNADAQKRMLSPHEAELRAYIAVGALTAQEANEWLERFARAARAVAASDEETASDAVRARAEELLENRVAALAPTCEARDPEASRRFHWALWALRRVGAISTQTHGEYKARAAPAPPQRPQAPPRPSFDAAVLQRVVAGPSLRLSAVRVICAELYRDCVVLRWHRLLTPDETAARDEFFPFANFPDGLLEQGRRWGAEFELHDNCETRYERVAGDSGMTHEYSRRRDDQPTPVWGYATFLPQVPRDATRLEAINGSDRFVVELTNH